MTTTTVPSLPLICLATAKDLSTDQVLHGKTSVIDFWTTRCTRCPAALDHINSLASDKQYAGIQFVSICCDQLDSAREIIENDCTNEPRWSKVHHYYMEPHHKEIAKSLLVFSSVPFYVVVDEFGTIVQKGNSINWKTLLAEIQRAQLCNKENEASSNVDSGKTICIASQNDRVFVLEDLDF